MSRKKVLGRCSICGNEGELTFEHVPPKSAFNRYDVVMASFEESLNLGPDDKFKGRIQQGGAGYHSICGSCNNKSGHWYGDAFAGFCYQGMNILRLSGGSPFLYHQFHTFPLRVIKQIVTMFFSINPHSLGKHTKYLSDFVLDRDRKYLPPDVRVYLYYNLKGRLRYNSAMATLSVTESNKVRFFSELTFPPFGYIFSITGNAPHKDQVDITHFANHEYNNWGQVELRLPALETHLSIPGDYRTKEQIQKDFEANQKPQIS